MPNYTKAGKILSPLTEDKFIEGMNDGKFTQKKHRAFVTLLFYTGVRVSEGLRAVKEQFTVEGENIFFEVGKRLKHGRKTQPLRIILTRPFVHTILEAVETTKDHKRVFPYSRMTGYRIVNRVFFYPHHLRLSRITILADKFSLSALVNWTGLNPVTIDYYIGLVETGKMAEV